MRTERGYVSLLEADHQSANTMPGRKLTRNCRAVLRVEVRINFIEEIERSRVALLNGEDCGKSVR